MIKKTRDLLGRLSKHLIKWCLLLWAVILLIALCFKLSGILINYESSMPRGFFIEVEEEPKAGDVAILRLPPYWQDFAKRRNMTAWDKVFKYVRAGEGDRVAINTEGIMVNDELLPNSAQLSKDSKGRDMPPFSMEERTLKAGEFVVLSNDHKKGFDSRYYGVVNRSNVLSKVEKMDSRKVVLAVGGIVIVFVGIYIFLMRRRKGRSELS